MIKKRLEEQIQNIIEKKSGASLCKVTKNMYLRELIYLLCNQ